MKKCKLWLEHYDFNYRAKFAPEFLDAMMIEGQVLIPGLAWWDNSDEIWRKKIKEEYYENFPEEITQKEELELEKSNPLWFCGACFEPDKIIDGVPYYAPRFYSDYFEGCFECCPSTEYTLLPFELNGKWGYVEEYSGEIFVQPIWDYAEPFNYHEAVVGKEMTGSGKACDIRCMKGDKVTIDDEPNVVLQLENIETGEIMGWSAPRLKNETFCKKACTVHFGIIDEKGNLKYPLEPDNDYVTSLSQSFFLYGDVTVTQKNGKFYIKGPLFWGGEIKQPIYEVDIIGAADENTVETKIADRLIFIQRND